MTLSALRVSSPETAWMADAACPKSGLPDAAFFPERGASSAPAKNACRACPVRTDCLNYALTEGIGHGIWGGLSVRERTAERRRRNMRLPTGRRIRR